MQGGDPREIILRVNDPSEPREAGGESRPLGQRQAGPPSREIQSRLLGLHGKGYRRVVLDFTGLPSIESATLGSILLLRQSLAEQGCALAVRGCSESLLAAFQLLRLDRLVCVEGEGPGQAG